MDAVRGLFESVPLDYFFLGGFALLVALDALRSGTGRAAAIAVALPAAAMLFAYAPDAPVLGGALSSPLVEAGFFLLFAIVMYFAMRRMGLEFLSNGMGQPLSAALAGVATTVIVAVIWMHIPALQEFWDFGPPLQAIFAEQFRLFWLLGAFAALAFVRG